MRETILVVDDNPEVLALVASVLHGAGFQVFPARDAKSAIRVANQIGWIDLLLSDIDMPGMSGPELGELLKEDRPEMYVMLMSGQHNGALLVLNYGWAFLQKPFVPTRLVEMVCNVLSSPNRSQSGGDGFDSKFDTAENREVERKRRHKQMERIWVKHK